MKNYRYKILFFNLIVPLCFFYSCIKEPALYKKNEKENTKNDKGENIKSEPYFFYPFKYENKNIHSEIIIKSLSVIDFNNLKAEIPPLKYNKTLLFMLTQDDLHPSAFSNTWAMINGKPICKGDTLKNKNYYSLAHLQNNDLPPDVYNLNKTLGSTDGTGNEVRFHFTFTIVPEDQRMNNTRNVNIGFRENCYRFFLDILSWGEVKELLNYGNGLSFHDVILPPNANTDDILSHLDISQKIILEKLNGRGCKMLAEPNGDKRYTQAAEKYSAIRTITNQNGGIKLIPFQIKNDLSKVVIERFLEEDINKIKEKIIAEYKLPKENRHAIYMMLHNSHNRVWTNLFIWLNNTYGKDGDDSIWMPSQEEYYEYSYYYIHNQIKLVKIDDYTAKLIIDLPSEDYFYFPSITVNIKGL